MLCSLDTILSVEVLSFASGSVEDLALCRLPVPCAFNSDAILLILKLVSMRHIFSGQACWGVPLFDVNRVREMSS